MNEPTAQPSLEREFYAQVLGSLSSGVLIIDSEGRLVESNPAASEHLGLSAEALQPGVPLHDLDEAGELQAVATEMMEDGKPIIRREMLLPSEQGERVVGLTASLLHQPDGFRGVIMLFADLTEVRRLEREAAINRQLAEIGELTAGVVHELRNPLAAISGLTELIARSNQDPEAVQRRAKTIMREVDELNHLVDQFLGFAKPFEPNLYPCDAKMIVDRALSLSRPLADARQVRLEARWEGAAPALKVDMQLLTHALSNLLGNAVEFSPAGASVVLRGWQDEKTVFFQVQDTGPGLALKPGEDPFKPFFSRRENGTGLGLAIVQRTVAAHGGRVAGWNGEEGGAVFEIQLPLDEQASAQ